MSGAGKRSVLVLALVACTLAAYAPALRGGFVWDDDDYVTENPTLRDLRGLGRIWLEPGATPQYYPLVHTSFWIERHLFGEGPLAYHVTNVALHAVCGLLVLLVLLRLGIEEPAALAAAALFLLHPIQVESVAWVTERKNVLSGVFYLLAALAWLGGRSRSRVAAAYALFVCALLSKTVTATLPLALGAVAWWKAGRVERRDVLRLVPMAAIGGAFAWLTASMERHHVGALGADWSLSLAQRLLVAGRAFWFYLGKLLWPHPLVFVYRRFDPSAEARGMALWLVAAIGTGVALWLLRRRIGRAPLAAYLVYGVTIAPALGFVNVYPMRFSFVADHFAYLAILAPLVLLASAGVEAVRPLGKRGNGAFGALVAATALACAAITFRQSRSYHDEETLWRDTLRKNPGAFLASNNLGGMLLLRGDLPGAERWLDAALRSKPDYPEALDNLGIVRERQGRTEEAAGLYREALRHAPRFADAHNNLGILLASGGRVEEAREHFAEAVRIRPGFANARFNLGLALETLGRFPEAASEYEEAARLDPRDSAAAQRLAWLRRTHPGLVRTPETTAPRSP